MQQRCYEYEQSQTELDKTDEDVLMDMCVTCSDTNPQVRSI